MRRKQVCPITWTAVLSALLLTAAASAQTVTITMDELPPQPVNGLTIKGVTFHDTTGAFFNSPNGGQLTYTQDPTTEGNATGEVLTLDFAFPVDNFRFGMAISTQGTVVGAMSVALYDTALNLIQTIPVDIGQPAGDAFSNALFTSHVLISRAVITFPAAPASFIAFGLDNVAFSSDYFQVRYAANLNVGDSVVNITNTGTSGGNICANIYTFDPAEELISCCTCSVTPNGLQSLSVRNSLISNPLTPAIPTSVVIKIVASTAATCNASSVTAGNFAAGLRAWGSTIHALPSTPVTYGVTETAFSDGGLVPTELSHLTGFCGFIQANGSGFGICKGCAAGGLGATPAQ